jgi:hypothetical protein
MVDSCICINGSDQIVRGEYPKVQHMRLVVWRLSSVQRAACRNAAAIGDGREEV